jgi:hypothetical protein
MDIFNKRIIDLTVGEFLEIQKRAEQPVVVDLTTGKTEKYVYGIDGIARLFGCSRRTAQTLKNSGQIDKAVKQFGRKIVVNADLAVQLVGKK